METAIGIMLYLLVGNIIALYFILGKLKEYGRFYKEDIEKFIGAVFLWPLFCVYLVIYFLVEKLPQIITDKLNELYGVIDEDD